MIHRSTAFLTDADNTLWDTDAVYRVAHAEIMDRLSRLLGVPEREDKVVYLRRFDEALALAHPERMRYPSQLLVRALALGLRGVEPSVAAGNVLANRGRGVLGAIDEAAILESFRSTLKTPPQLREGVAEGLSRLVTLRTHFVVLTEGEKDRIERTLLLLGLPMPSRVLEVRKTPETFRNIRAQVAPSVPLLMVGDQVDRDIIPARHSGLRTVLFPSSFAPKWNLGLAGTELADRTVRSFDEAVSYFEREVMVRKQSA